MNFLTYIFIGLTPFSYGEIFGIRVLIFQIIIGIVFLIHNTFKKNRLSFYLDSSVILIIPLWFLILGFSLHTEYFNELQAVSTFIMLLFITSQFDSTMLESIVKYYKLAVLFTAGGIIFQFLMHRFTGIELFRYQLFGGGRNAYSFIWEDYSFISLFVVSAIPLFFVKKINFHFFIFSFFLLISSIMTSARTGVAAFILFIILYIGNDIFKSLIIGRLKKSSLITLFIILALPPFLIAGMEGFTGRQVTGSSSGRIDDFIIGYQYLKESFLFGSFFDKISYYNTISTIPHNIFIYILYMGGLASFLIFIFWLIFLIIKLKNADNRITSSLLICLLGFQFIPSFFSAYFLAVLIGIAIVSVRQHTAQNIFRKR